MHPRVPRHRTTGCVARGKDGRQVRLRSEGAVADRDVKEYHAVERRQSGAAGGACHEAARVDQLAPLAVTLGNECEDSGGSQPTAPRDARDPVRVVWIDDRNDRVEAGRTDFGRSAASADRSVAGRCGRDRLGFESVYRLRPQRRSLRGGAGGDLAGRVDGFEAAAESACGPGRLDQCGQQSASGPGAQDGPVGGESAGVGGRGEEQHAMAGPGVGGDDPEDALHQPRLDHAGVGMPGVLGDQPYGAWALGTSRLTRTRAAACGQGATRPVPGRRGGGAVRGLRAGWWCRHAHSPGCGVTGLCAVTAEGRDSGLIWTPRREVRRSHPHLGRRFPAR